MARPIRLNLSPRQRQELQDSKTRDDKPYIRERATAILKIADGMSARQVALCGLLSPRDPDTVYSWVHRYLENGIQGLEILPGRGRKKGSP